MQLAGPALIFLILDTFLYWGILAFIEYGYLKQYKKKIKGGNSLKHQSITTPTSFLGYIDDQVKVEENRVKRSTNLDVTTVRV
mmetsp:Transcript_22569/g.21743  ORF Transcript_22569/g.21743 Transcript_22569/m.21743 type:complete len:83 (-) Transcript_22569:1185-1433(-)